MKIVFGTGLDLIRWTARRLPLLTSPKLKLAYNQAIVMAIVVVMIIGAIEMSIAVKVPVAAMITRSMTKSAGGFRIFRKGEMTGPKIAKTRPLPPFPIKFRHRHQGLGTRLWNFWSTDWYLINQPIPRSQLPAII